MIVFLLLFDVMVCHLGLQKEASLKLIFRKIKSNQEPINGFGKKKLKIEKNMIEEKNKARVAILSGYSMVIDGG